ncbi:MAG: very short patch repair endonuclease [Gammaproteobacteria bacterium]|nr:very short patch repair endonuclease [Gammaproteobacteria bacterium]
MVDVVSPETRSRMMSGIRGKDTNPEMLIRRSLHKQGFRYKLHESTLPGRPDLAFPRYRAVIFVNGCFWHGHDCHLFKWPGTNLDFWRKKIGRNREKDNESLAALDDLGWRVLVIWECALKGRNRLPFDVVVRDVSYWLTEGQNNVRIRGHNPEHFTSERREDEAGVSLGIFCRRSRQTTGSSRD